MKKFLALCTFAMISAGIYGFVDMAHDVKKGTMIQYDRGGDESAMLADAGNAILENQGLLHIALKTEKIPVKETPKKIAVKKQKTASTKTVVGVDPNPVVNDPIVIEAKQDVKIDSVPQVVLQDIDYRDFSRGEPRKQKSKRHSKK